MLGKVSGQRRSFGQSRIQRATTFRQGRDFGSRQVISHPTDVQFGLPPSKEGGVYRFCCGPHCSAAHMVLLEEPRLVREYDCLHAVA
jgi:hypothetical protein